MSDDEATTKADRRYYLDQMHARCPDWLLGVLVDGVAEVVTDASKRGTDVTLTVKGLTITGEIVPDWVWADGVHQVAIRSTPDAGPDQTSQYSAMRDAFKQVASERAETDADESPDSDHDDVLERLRKQLVDTPTFIHLRDAHIVTPQGLIPNQDGWWRGLLASVDGWFPGRLS